MQIAKRRKTNRYDPSRQRPPIWDADLQDWRNKRWSEMSDEERMAEADAINEQQKRRFLRMKR